VCGLIQAFAMIDNDRDGIIGSDDLAAIYNSIGNTFVASLLQQSVVLIMTDECSPAKDTEVSQQVSDHSLAQ